MLHQQLQRQPHQQTEMLQMHGLPVLSPCFALSSRIHHMDALCKQLVTPMHILPHHHPTCCVPAQMRWRSGSSMPPVRVG
jgi:hypothetical protein